MPILQSSIPIANGKSRKIAFISAIKFLLILGEHFTGQVKATFVRGELVYEDGRFPTTSGRECRV